MEKLLIIDDDVDMTFLLHNYLGRKGYHVTEVHTSGSALDYLEYNQPDLIVCDIWLDEMDGIALLKIVKEKYPSMPFIFITAYDDIKTSAYALKLGAMDYVTKPLLPEEIAAIIKKALDRNKSVKHVDAASFLHKMPDYFTGASESFKKLERQINLIAPTDKSVIIYGETGTGKETVAKEIHKRSNRSDKDFIIINAASLSVETAEIDLFGYSKESALVKEGLLEKANGGTVFIYEIDKLPKQVQTLLMEAIKEKRIPTNGGSNYEDLNIRWIAGSHENLWHAARRGRLLDDVYHKFNDYSIDLLPLRNRKEDIIGLAKYFMQKANEESGKNIQEFSPEVETILMNYIWMDNVRELRNVIGKAVLKAQSDIIDASLLPTEILPSKLSYPPANGGCLA